MVFDFIVVLCAFLCEYRTIVGMSTTIVTSLMRCLLCGCICCGGRWGRTGRRCCTGSSRSLGWRTTTATITIRFSQILFDISITSSTTARFISRSLVWRWCRFSSCSCWCLCSGWWWCSCSSGWWCCRSNSRLWTDMFICSDGRRSSRTGFLCIEQQGMKIFQPFFHFGNCFWLTHLGSPCTQGTSWHVSTKALAGLICSRISPNSTNL